MANATAVPPDFEGDPTHVDEEESRRLWFVYNMRTRRKAAGLKIKEIAERCGFHPNQLSMLTRKGTTRFNATTKERAEKMARILGFSEAEEMFFPASDPPAPPPEDLIESVEEARFDHPELFADFDEWDWRQINGERGMGGAPTKERVIQQARRINESRELRKRFEILIDTHHFSTIKHFIDALYEAAEVPADI